MFEYFFLFHSAAPFRPPECPWVGVKLRVEVRGLPDGGLLVQRLVLRHRLLALRVLQLEPGPGPGRAGQTSKTLNIDLDLDLILTILNIEQGDELWMRYLDKSRD